MRTEEAFSFAHVVNKITEQACHKLPPLRLIWGMQLMQSAKMVNKVFKGVLNPHLEPYDGDAVEIKRIMNLLENAERER